ncbi:MAG: class I SAM-dependent methyltransferase [Kiritimatiellae bacterium]|nr:class I SAM-dependent methyltransferase [Kiritimatiellia bacterium]MDD5521922.1 class I SAM-dependent methyltransferase [Kiritimatiellia bacterium]
MNEVAWFLSVNPVSSIRYFEFPFIERYMPHISGGRYLDVSSPMLFGCWWLAKHSDVEIDFINPDKNDLYTNNMILKGLGFQGRARFCPQDASKLPWPDGTFDGIWMISVIEHIAEPDDIQALLELQRVLGKGAKLVLTTIVSSEFRKEYRSYSTYKIANIKPDAQGNYFFQRRYDAQTLKSRIIDVLDRMTLRESEIWTEKKDGLFDEYVQGWLKNGIKTTNKDPLLMSKYFEKRDFHDLKGFGIGCYLFEKNS